MYNLNEIKLGTTVRNFHHSNHQVIAVSVLQVWLVNFPNWKPTVGFHAKSVLAFTRCLNVIFYWFLSLFVFVWLLLVPKKISGIRGARTVHEGSNLHSVNLRSFGSTRTKHQLDQRELRQWTKEILVCGRRIGGQYLTVLHMMVSVTR